MPRTRRIVVPNTPHHVVQRGHNKQSVFSGHDDFEMYLSLLRTWTREFDVKVFGYCLMTNHVHLVLEPGPSVASLARLMKQVTGIFTQRINKLYERTGTLWESRFKSSPIQTDRYLLACCRYVDLNPVAAGMVGHPGDYRWSSFRQKTNHDVPMWINPDPCYLALGTTAAERMRRYERFVNDAPPARRDTELIRRALRSGNPTGDEGFVDEIEKATGRFLRRRGRGRPRRTEKNGTCPQFSGT